MNRREFIVTTLGAGAALALRIETRGEPFSFAHGAFLEIRADGAVWIAVSRSEMGQGVRTSLPMLIADELDAKWEDVKIRQAPLDAKFGQQRTGGSLSIRELWEPLRMAGATARSMLVRAAAETWNVDSAGLRTENGRVHDPISGKIAAYGALVAKASALPVPADVRLKAPDSFRIIGTSRRRLDGPDIVTGRAQYGLDVRIPGMRYATFLRCPVIGGKVRSFDATAAAAVPGVRHIVPIDGTAVSWLLQWSSGIAIVADSTWAALRAREALEVEWDEGPNARLEQEDIESTLLALADTPGLVVRDDGDADDAGTRISADYTVPYLAHAPVEPMNCVVSIEDGRCRVWAPTQLPQGVRTIVSRVLGIDPAQVAVEITLLGGGFGRRLYADYAGEAALIAKATGERIQLIWTRHDDMMHGFYRPISHHRMTATVERSCIRSWHHRISGPSRRNASGPTAAEPEESETYAAVEMPYEIARTRVDYNHIYLPVPCGPWRGVAYSQTGFVIESFIDELAHLSGVDPVAFRLAHLHGKPFLDHDGEGEISPERMRRVLELAVSRAGTIAGRNVGRGVAVTFDHGSAVAHVAEVSVTGKRLRVHRFVTAIDCGIAVNPDHVRAQVESGIVFGLSAALKEEITVRRGRVAQSTYADYPVLRMDETPEIEVHIVPSIAAPGGVGEPPIAGVAPAVANAVFAATGVRLRRLPLAMPAS